MDNYSNVVHTNQIINHRTSIEEQQSVSQ
jgi:hypothetical protein